MSTVRSLSGGRLVLMIATSLISLLIWAVGFPQVHANAQTSELTLVEAKVVVNIPAAARRVRLTFSNDVCNVLSQTGFSLVGAPGVPPASTGAFIMANGCGTTVDVIFAGAPTLTLFTSVMVAAGTVTDASGQGNTTAQFVTLTVGVPLPPPVALPIVPGGTGIPLTAGPDFVTVSLNASLTQVRYQFDVPLDAGTAPAASDFGYRNLKGEDVDSASVHVQGNTVLAEFSDPISDDLRFYVRAEAVQDLLGRLNPPNAIFGPVTPAGTLPTPAEVAAAAAAAAAAAPELAAVAPVAAPPAPPTQFTFTFTQPVSLLALDGFALYDAAGMRYQAKSWVQAAPNMLQLDMAVPTGVVAVIGTVDAGAVEGTIGTVASNGVGCVVVGAAGPAAVC
ncbi:MAG: hypothetical protein ACRD0K_23500 [Egibacteraceae bacterium]